MSWKEEPGWGRKLYQFIKKYVNGKGTGRQDERGLKDPRSGNRDPGTR
jgi:hypothetical protein